MFCNICSNFLEADSNLKSNIIQLLKITEQLNYNTKYMDSARPEMPKIDTSSICYSGDESEDDEVENEMATNTNNINTISHSS